MVPSQNPVQPQPCEMLPIQNPAQIAWLPQVCCRVAVVLMKGDDPWDFLLSYPDRQKQLSDLQSLLQSRAQVVCSAPPPEGSPVVILEGGQYHRAITVGPISKTGRVSVLKIDFGETAWVKVSQLYSMQEDVANFPCQVMRCCLNIHDAYLKSLWDFELKSHFFQLCQCFPLKIDVVQKLMHCESPMFLVKMWMSNKKLNEEADIGRWLDEALFPVLKDAQNAGEDSSDAFLSLYDVLSPFSVPLDELYEEHSSGDEGIIIELNEVSDVAQNDIDVHEAAGMELRGIQDVSDASEDDVAQNDVDVHVAAGMELRGIQDVSDASEDDVAQNDVDVHVAAGMELRGIQDVSDASEDDVAQNDVDVHVAAGMELRGIQDVSDASEDDVAQNDVDVHVAAGMELRCIQDVSDASEDDVAQDDVNVHEPAGLELRGGQDFSDASEDDEHYKIDEPRPEQIKISVAKVSQWMTPRIKEPVVEPSFDHHVTKRIVSANSKMTSDSITVSPDHDTPVASGVPVSALPSGAQQGRSDSDACVTNANSPYLPPEGQRVKIVVHHVLSGTSFYATIHEFSVGIGCPGATGNTMTSLYEAINERNSHPRLDSAPHVGQTVLAQGLQRYLGKGKKWLRAVVKAIIIDTKVEVIFSDFGNMEIISVNDLRAMPPEFSSFPFQAIFVKLALLEPVEQCKREAHSKLTQLIKGKTLSAEITRRDVASTGLEVILFHDDGMTCINNLLADRGLCMPA